MNTDQLKKALTELCKEQPGGMTFSIEGYRESIHVLIWRHMAGVWYKSIHIDLDKNRMHLYWSIAYQAIKDGNISLEKAEEIYNQNI